MQHLKLVNGPVVKKEKIVFMLCNLVLCTLRTLYIAVYKLIPHIRHLCLPNMDIPECKEMFEKWESWQI